MVEEIFLSVVVPVYNVEKYLCECLDSLVYQTKKFEEIILINDGSTDNCKEICEEYCAKNANMILVNQDNQGLSAARNAGIQNARGKYVLFVDSDDFVSADMHVCVHDFLKENDLDILFYNANTLDEAGVGYKEDRYIRSRKLYGHIMTGINFLGESYPNDYIVAAWLAVYNKLFLENHRIVFPYGLYYEDNVFYIHALLNASRVKCIPDCLYTRRYRNGSITVSDLTKKKCMDYLEIHCIIWDLLYLYEHKAKYKKLYKRYLSVQMGGLFRFLNGYRQDTDIEKKLDEMVKIFVRYWSNLFMGEDASWNDIYFLAMYAHNLQFNMVSYGMILDIASKGISSKLKLLPFAYSNKEIGIYGSGRHTEKLIKLYEQYVGHICCKYYFIETHKCMETYMGRPVTDCDHILKDTDGIIISSMIHEKSMLRELQLRNITQDKIILLYDEEDTNDLVAIADLLEL